MNLPIKSHNAASDDASRTLQVNFVDTIAYLIIFANVVNLYFARTGIMPDLLVLAASIPAFLWALNTGIADRRIRFYLLIVTALFGLYLVYSISQQSLLGIRNSVALFTVTATFLFFFSASRYLLRSMGFFVALLLPLGSFVFLAEIPFAVGKNNINGAMCYYLIAIFFCHPGLVGIRTRHVTLLFVLIFGLSAINGHRALAAASVLLLLQYYVLATNVARNHVRFSMFAGLVVVVGGIIALLADPSMTVYTSALDALVTSEGGRTVMSGRQVLWPVVWQAIAANPLLGMGPGTVLSDIYTTNLSAHNLYLHTGLQIGYPGFVMLTLLFWSLWRAADPVGPAVARSAENLVTVVITMVAVHSLFEVFLFQNALVIGVPVWMVLGLGLGALANEAALAKPMQVIERLTHKDQPAQHE